MALTEFVCGSFRIGKAVMEMWWRLSL